MDGIIFSIFMNFLLNIAIINRKGDEYPSPGMHLKSDSYLLKIIVPGIIPTVAESFISASVL